jgi:hypothetical protein
LGCQPHTQLPTWRIRTSLLVWAVTFDLSGMGGPASSYATASIAFRIIWPHKPHHYFLVEIRSVGKSRFFVVKLKTLQEWESHFNCFHIYYISNLLFPVQISWNSLC